MADALVLTAQVAPDMAGVRRRLAEPTARPISVLRPLGAAGLAAATALMAAWAVILGPSDAGPDRAGEAGPVSVFIAPAPSTTEPVGSVPRPLQDPGAPAS